MGRALIQITDTRIEVNAWPLVVVRVDLAPTRSSLPASTRTAAWAQPSAIPRSVVDRVVTGASRWWWQHMMPAHRLD
jgi:hypothetical protein